MLSKLEINAGKPQYLTDSPWVTGSQLPLGMLHPKTRDASDDWVRSVTIMVIYSLILPPQVT